MTTEISTNTAPARGLALASFDDAFRFSQMVAKSEFAPKDFKGKPESCLLAIQHGSEVGLSPMQSLQSIAVINGRPTIWGDAALALVQSSPVCEYVKEFVEGQGDSLTAVCEVKRRGYPAPTTSRFSMADAKRAGLAGKAGPWSQYPERMLALRARLRPAERLRRLPAWACHGRGSPGLHGSDAAAGSRAGWRGLRPVRQAAAGARGGASEV